MRIHICYIAFLRPFGQGGGSVRPHCRSSPVAMTLVVPLGRVMDRRSDLAGGHHTAVLDWYYRRILCLIY